MFTSSLGLHVQFQPRMGHPLPTADILYICYQLEEPCCQIYILPNLPFHLIMLLQAFMYNSSHGWGINYQQPIYCTFCYQPEEPCCQIYILPNLPFHLIMLLQVSRPSCTIPATDGASITNSQYIVHFVTSLRNRVVKFISYPIFHSIS